MSNDRRERRDAIVMEYMEEITKDKNPKVISYVATICILFRFSDLPSSDPNFIEALGIVHDFISFCKGLET